MSLTQVSEAPLAGRSTRARVRAHSRFVRVLRLALPLAMVAVVGVLAGFVLAHAIKRQASAGLGSASIRMVGARFSGTDNQGRPYTLTAEQASRDDQDFQRVLLQKPTVTVGVGSPRPSTLTADTGVYREDTRILILKGHVRAKDAQSSSAATDEAIVNTGTGQVTGPAALSSQTAVGAVQAHSFQAYDKGDRVVFKGGVHARLNQH